VKLQEEFLRVYKDFTIENGIEKSKEVLQNIAGHEEEFYKLKLYELLASDSRFKSLQYLCRLLFVFPKALAKKWFWGGLRRIIFGVSAIDPLRKRFDNTENKANWNLND
jgi:hypothetical protein